MVMQILEIKNLEVVDFEFFALHTDSYEVLSLTRALLIKVSPKLLAIVSYVTSMSMSLEDIVRFPRRI